MDALVFFYGDAAEAAQFFAAAVFNSFSEFQASGIAADLFVIGTANPEKIFELLLQLRHDTYCSLKPIFICNEPKHSRLEIDALSDGRVESLPEVAEKTRKITDLRRQIPIATDVELSDVQRLLAFLYTRPNKKITPIKNWRDEKIYNYPLADAIINTEAPPRQWLETLAEKHYLQHEKLIDRLRICPFCFSGHISYVDICPNCHSLNIEEQPFLHCFTCGTVAPQEDFLHGNTLRCPNCSALLRHIGSDYDRPLENYQCNDCKNKFIDPDMTAECLICNKHLDLAQLISISIFVYELAQQGRLHIESGNTELVFDIFENVNYMKSEVFLLLLDWFLNLARRYEDIYFSLLLIGVNNIDEVAATIGLGKVNDLLVALADKIRNKIRSTDLLTRVEDNKIIILLPQTHNQGAQILKDHLQKLAQEKQDFVQLHFQAKVFSVTKEKKVEENANVLLANLLSELENE